MSNGHVTCWKNEPTTPKSRGASSFDTNFLCVLFCHFAYARKWRVCQIMVVLEPMEMHVVVKGCIIKCVFVMTHTVFPQNWKEQLIVIDWAQEIFTSWWILVPTYEVRSFIGRPLLKQHVGLGSLASRDQGVAYLGVQISNRAFRFMYIYSIYIYTYILYIYIYQFVLFGTSPSNFVATWWQQSGWAPQEETTNLSRSLFHDG